MTPKAQFLARQGDILFFAVPTIPKGVKPIPRENGRVVLAHGEVTGHAHVIDSDTAVFLATDLDEMSDRFLRIVEEEQVTHDEHDAITLPSPDWLQKHGFEGIGVRRQREYAPEAIRTVSD